MNLKNISDFYGELNSINILKIKWHSKYVFKAFQFIIVHFLI